MTNFYFVIDTDHYAGNFEREMCAYMTGETGDCGVGHKEADLFQEEVREGKDEDYHPFGDREDLIGSEPDEHGCRRPVKIYQSPNWFNNGNGGHFRNDDPDAEEKAQTAHDEEVMRYANETIRKCYADKDYGNKQADEHITRLFGKPMTKFAAYMSVAICLNEHPVPREIEFLKERAYKFAENYRDFDGTPIEIEGFRLVTIRTVIEARPV